MGTCREQRGWTEGRGPSIAAGGSYLYNHELGYDDDGSSMNSFIESAVMDMDDGDRFTYISRIVPDLTFNGVY